jgi:exosortase
MSSTSQSVTATSHRASTLKVWLPLGLFAVLWGDLVRQLSYAWETNEQYAYGWFVPFLALALFVRRWMDRPSANPQPSTLNPQLLAAPKLDVGGSAFKISAFALPAFVVLLCLLLLPLRVIHEINPDWPLASWLLTLLVVALSFYAVFLAGGWRWVKYFAFPICFILVAVQWPYRIEHSLTQNLMQVVANLTVEILGWFNIPALQHGNLIELSTGVLGVDEACSGIRSFQSTLMAALFLGELYRLRPAIRFLLVGVGLTAAFFFNVCRTLFLTWEANAHGVSAIDKWHDPAGFTIAVACFGVLWLLAVLIKRKWSPSAPLTMDGESRNQKVESGNVLATPDQCPQPATDHGPPTTDPGPLNSDISAPRPLSPGPKFQFSAFPISAFALPAFSFRACRRYLLAVGLWSLLCIAATEIWYRLHAIPEMGVFHWTVALPEAKPGFEKIEMPPRTLKLLAFDAGSTSMWNEDDGSEFSLFFFRWNPRSIRSVIQSRIHRPEDCLPASGFKQLTESELVFFDAGQLKLPFRKYTYEADGRSLFVFFCQWEDGAETQTGMGVSTQTERLRTVWVGRRLVGQQTLEILVTGSPSLAEAEALVRRRLPELIRREAAQPPPRRISERAP